MPVITITNYTDDAETVPDHTRRRNSQVVVTATPRHMQLVTAAYLLFLSFGVVRFVRLWIAKERLRRSANFDGLTQAVLIARRARR